MNFWLLHIMFLRSWINARFVDKYHTCPTGLSKNHYHEIDTRMFHATFQLLVDYVESEVAWESLVMEDVNKYSKHYFKRKFIFFLHKYFFINYKNPERGIRRLLGKDNYDFDIGRAGSEFENIPDCNVQAVELYQWYVDDYLKRPNDYLCRETTRRYYEKYKRMPSQTGSFAGLASYDSNYYKIFSAVDKEVEDEEDRKLQQLVNLRRTMWT